MNNILNKKKVENKSNATNLLLKVFINEEIKIEYESFHKTLEEFELNYTRRVENCIGLDRSLILVWENIESEDV